ncbi:MAG: hypothetical protein AAF253_05250 [Pseudomonadota bacterium]
MRDPSSLSIRDAAQAPELFARPKLGSGDLLAIFWLAKWWMLGAALPVLIAGWAWAAMLPDRPVARAVVAVSGDVGPVSAGELSRQAKALEAYGRSDRALEGGIVLPPGSLRAVTIGDRSAVAVLLDGAAVPAPQGVLEALIDGYIADQAPAVAEAAAASSGSMSAFGSANRLATALAARDGFLQSHGLTDYDAEIRRLDTLLGTAETALVSAEARHAALDRQRTVLERRVRDTPETLEAGAAGPLAGDLEALRRERAQLLTRYTAQSVPVRTIDQQIEALERQGASRPRLTETGAETAAPNPTYEALQRDRLALLGDLETAAATRDALRQQVDAARRRVETLAGLQPEWRRIERAIMAAEVQAGGVTGFAGDERSGGAVSLALSRRGPAVLSNSAEAWRNRIRWSAGLLAVLAALLAGVLFARGRRSFATPGSAARTLNRPVIAAIPKRRA